MDPSPKFLFWRIRVASPKNIRSRGFTYNTYVSVQILFNCQTMCAAWSNLRSKITLINSYIVTRNVRAPTITSVFPIE